MTDRVAELWRYPVKSMIGERVAATEVNERGIAGDRGWAVRDEVRGGIRGSKKIGGLMALRAAWVGDAEVEITLPSGQVVRSSDADVDAQLSKALDHEVTLWPLQPEDDLDHYRRGAPDSDDVVAELRQIFDRTEDEPLPDLSVFPPVIFEYESPPGTYFDAFPLHLLTTSSMRVLQDLAPESVVDVRRFRPNVLIASDDDGLVEQAWVGRRVAIGEVKLEVTAPCPRCVMITRPLAELPQDRRLIRTVVRELDQNFGVYANVVSGGTVREGDEVRVM